jgi:hypothetical protein
MVIVSFLSIVVLTIGLFSFIKLNPPLVSGTVVTSENNHALVVEIGNKGLSNVKIKGVLINNNEQPLMRKMQVSNHLKGFLITDTLNSEAGEYGMSEMEDVAILPDTSPTTQLEKANNGTATKNDKIYHFPTEDSRLKECEGRSPMSRREMNVGWC